MADHAMYDAKRAGGGLTVVVEPAAPPTISEPRRPSGRHGPAGPALPVQTPAPSSPLNSIGNDLQAQNASGAAGGPPNNHDAAVTRGAEPSRERWRPAASFKRASSHPRCATVVDAAFGQASSRA